MAQTISFARGAPSLDIVDVDGLRAAADRGVHGRSRRHDRLRDRDRLPAAARVDRRAPPGRRPSRCSSPTARCRPTRSCSTRSCEPGRRGDRRAPDLRPDAAVAAQPRRRRADGRARARRDRRRRARARARRPARKPKLAHIIPNFQNPAGYTLSADEARAPARARPRPRVHDLRGRPVRGAALRGRAAADDALDGPRRDRRLRLVVLQDRLPGHPRRLPRRAGGADRPDRQARHQHVHLAEHGRAGDRPRVLPSPARSSARSRPSRGAARARRHALRGARARAARRALRRADRRLLPVGRPARAAPMSARCSRPPPTRGVQFVKGTDFVLDGGESTLRLAYSGVTPEQIEEGVKRLAEAYRRARRGAGQHAA